MYVVHYAFVRLSVLQGVCIRLAHLRSTCILLNRLLPSPSRYTVDVYRYTLYARCVSYGHCIRERNREWNFYCSVVVIAVESFRSFCYCAESSSILPSRGKSQSPPSLPRDTKSATTGRESHIAGRLRPVCEKHLLRSFTTRDRLYLTQRFTSGYHRGEPVWHGTD